MTLPIGVFINAACVLVGGVLGAAAGKKMPQKLKIVLPMSFSLGAMAIGVSGLMKMQSLPPVIIALLLGTIVGTLFGFEALIKRCGSWVSGKMQSGREVNTSESVRRRYHETFSIAVILFCAGATGIYGSLHAGISGDHSILVAKAALDFFTAIIFATSIGYGVSLMAVPMLIIFSFFFYAAAVIVPYTTSEMYADFSGCGGLLMLATGFRMAEIKLFHVADMLPALFFVMPISALWQYLSSAVF